MRPFLTMLTLVLLLAVPRPARAVEHPRPPVVVVTTSMLEAAVREVVTDDEVRVQELLPPGSCPGHFDLPPSARPTIREAMLLLRHDFEATLDAKVRAAGADDAVVSVVPTSSGLLLPANYGILVDHVAQVLTDRLPQLARSIARRKATTHTRLATLEKTIQSRVAGLAGTPVVASSHQADLCRWLGLRVVGTLTRPEDLPPHQFQELLATTPRVVVGNLQEGTEAAAILAQRLGVPLVVFSNFPGAPGYGAGFDQVLLANLERLERACSSP